MSFTFRMGQSTVHEIFKETCKVVWNVLQQQYVKVPSTSSDGISISLVFENCIGINMYVITI